MLVPQSQSAQFTLHSSKGFNDSLWRRFEEPDFASVCILVTHGLMSRVFLMKWYHFSVEYFEDLRNINHCEFVVMKKDHESGKYVLQNQLRTWTEYRRERQARGSISQPEPPLIPVRRKWGGCSDGCSHDQHNHAPKSAPLRPPARQSTADLFNDDGEPLARTPPRPASGSSPLVTTGRTDSAATIRPASDGQTTTTGLDKVAVEDMASAEQASPDAVNGPSTHNNVSFTSLSLSQARLQRPSLLSLGGRDGGGSKSGAASVTSTSDPESQDEEAEGEDDHVDPLMATQQQQQQQQHVRVPWPKNGLVDMQPRSLARALKGEFGTSVEEGEGGRVMADALGDQSEDEKTDVEIGEEKEREKTEMQKIVDAEKRERSASESVY